MTAAPSFPEYNAQKNRPASYFFAGFLFFLPFSQALTIPLFFPLKISELFLFFYATAALLGQKTYKLPISRFFILIYLFVLLVALSMFINIFSKYNYELNTQVVRLSATADSVFKFIYLIIAIVSLISSYKILKQQKYLLKFLFWGTAVSCAYCWYLFFSGIFHLPVIKLPGMDSIPQNITTSFGDFIRCGTAKEGNFMACFLIVAGVIAFQFNFRRMGVLFFCTILTTFSTIAIIAIPCYFILTKLYNTSVSKVKVASSIVVVLFIVSTLTVISADFRSLVVNKVFGTVDTVDNANDIYSRVDRLNLSAVGLEIFTDNALWGVGISNYGLHFDHFNTLPQLDAEFKHIPNDVYVEILCESGLLAFIAFILIVLKVFNLLKGIRFIHLKSGLIIMLIYFFAFPTYTMLFIWVFLAVIMEEVESKSVNTNEYLPVADKIIT